MRNSRLVLCSTPFVVLLGIHFIRRVTQPDEMIRRDYFPVVVESDTNGNGIPDTWTEIIQRPDRDVLMSLYRDENEDGRLDLSVR